MPWGIFNHFLHLLHNVDFLNQRLSFMNRTANFMKSIRKKLMKHFRAISEKVDFLPNMDMPVPN